MTRVESTTHISKDRSPNRMPVSVARSTSSAGIRARGRRGESLASARDRKRLRERNTQERERVEGMIDSMAVPVERRTRRRESLVAECTTRSLPSGHHPGVHAGVRADIRAVQPVICAVCGDGRIVTDEVMHGGNLRVSECLHCEHRWTERPKGRWVELGARMNRDARPRALQVVEHRLATRNGSQHRR